VVAKRSMPKGGQRLNRRKPKWGVGLAQKRKKVGEPAGAGRGQTADRQSRQDKIYGLTGEEQNRRGRRTLQAKRYPEELRLEKIKRGIYFTAISFFGGGVVGGGGRGLQGGKKQKSNWE